MMRSHDEALRQGAIAKDTYPVRGSLGEAGGAQRFLVNGGAVRERLVQVADVDNQKTARPRGIAEASLGDSPKQGHLAAFEHADWHIGAGAGPLPLAAAGGRLAVAAARAPANALFALQ